jgi:hypothetical protein
VEEKQNSSAPLSSWKEIASFLGVSERTAQKWEVERGLPVQRMPGSRGRISADPEALTRWRNESLRGPSPRNSRKPVHYYAAAATILLLVFAFFLVREYVVKRHVGPPVGHRLEGNTLIVTDRAGREVWRYSFPDLLFPSSYDQSTAESERRVWHGPFGPGDPVVHTLFVYDPVTRDASGATLYCFSQAGEEEWRFTPGKVVSDHTQTFSPIYFISDFHVAQARKGGPTRILVSSHHVNSDPCQIAVLDAAGQTLGQYWHSGFLPHMEITDLDGDDTQDVLLGGVNNGYHAATLVVLDSENVAGASTQGKGDHTQLRDFGPGTEKAVILFPRTCISMVCCKDTYNRVMRLNIPPNGAEVEVNEVENDLQASVIYRFDDHLNLISAEPSDHLKNLHNQMQASGKLDHALSQAEVDRLKNLIFLKKPDWLK